MEYVNWVIQNWDSVASVALQIIGAASIIVKLTPTPKDDAVLAKIVKIFELLSLKKK